VTIVSAPYEFPVMVHSFVAGISYAAGQYRAFKLDSNQKAILASAAARITGVVQNDPGLGETATVEMLGITVAETGGAFAAGALLAVDAAGRFVLATSGQQVVAEAMTPSGGTGRYAAVFLRYLGVA
jgi:hypothetical protein